MENKRQIGPANFQAGVWEAAKKIPKGKVAAYKILASALGKPGAARAVGNALNKNRHTEVPCHRVIRSDGKIGGFTGGTEAKEKKLRRESVKIVNGKIDLKIYGFGRFHS